MDSKYPPSGGWERLLPPAKCRCGHSASKHVEYERIYAEPCGVKGCACANYKPAAGATSRGSGESGR